MMLAGRTPTWYYRRVSSSDTVRFTKQLEPSVSASRQRPAAFDRSSRWPLLSCLGMALIGLSPTFPRLVAQDNYEIQVYGSETVPAGQNMIELHSNYTIQGTQETVNGVLPDHHAFHETLEFTHGFTPWFETGFYVFSSIQPGNGWQWVGDHIRPRVRAPEEWHWPVGVSLSMEVGYQRRNYSEDTWTWEIRPIIDKQWGRWYVALNPTLGLSLHGANSNRGFDFAPSLKLSYDITKVVAAGIEYYSDLGPLTHFESLSAQQHQIMPTIDLNVSPKWEINFGVGIGLTAGTDDLLVKFILGRRF
jgi:hypothetical protein